MHTIAQKLCNEIVNPVLKSTSKTSDNKHKHYLHQSSNSKQDGRTRRSIVIEKKKVINKLIPRDNNSNIVINKFKSKETLLKKHFVDISCNTLVTGPLRCDNDCVTMVRKRDNQNKCKCGQKRGKCDASVKQVQTYDIKNYALNDKACAQCIETISCGTQFLEKLSGNKTKSKIYSDMDTQPGVKVAIGSRPEVFNKMNYYRGVKRWALSQYPTHGPDF